MDLKARLAVSAAGVLCMVGSVLCAHSTISLISFAWDMTAEFGFRETAGYLVATGVESALSLLVVPLLLVFGALIAAGAWTEADR